MVIEAVIGGGGGGAAAAAAAILIVILNVLHHQGAHFGDGGEVVTICEGHRRQLLQMVVVQLVVGVVSVGHKHARLIAGSH